MHKIILLFILVTISAINAQSMSCQELFASETSAVLQRVPNRVLTPLELAYIVRDYAIENEAEIVRQLAEKNLIPMAEFMCA